MSLPPTGTELRLAAEFRELNDDLMAMPNETRGYAMAYFLSRLAAHFQSCDNASSHALREAMRATLREWEKGTF